MGERGEVLHQMMIINVENIEKREGACTTLVGALFFMVCLVCWGRGFILWEFGATKR